MSSKMTSGRHSVKAMLDQASVRGRHAEVALDSKPCANNTKQNMTNAQIQQPVLHRERRALCLVVIQLVEHPLSYT